MRGRPVLSASAAILAATAPTELLRTRIAVLLGDPCVARRVRQRLDRLAETMSDGSPGTPPCFRASGILPPAPLLVRSGLCRRTCGAVDCLCGSYPRRLTDQEISDGTRLEPLAV
jgi:hypothetical protein